jgi:uncharacterized protein (TIGR03083 family)
MMTAITTDSIPAITRHEMQGLATTEYTRMAEQLRSLTTEDWSKPTDCPLWDVRAMAGHNLGMMNDFTSFRSLMRRMRAATKAAKEAGGLLIDTLTAMQVTDNADLSTAEVISRVEEIGPRAARWRTKAPALLRKMPMKQEFGGKVETWRMGYLLDVILTRDPWMHRVDIARATGREIVLTPEHDGRIIADVVAEWARRHGKPFALTLTGPAGGVFVAGDGGDPITIDAIEFCRVLAGRAAGTGLLNQPVPF